MGNNPVQYSIKRCISSTNHLYVTPDDAWLLEFLRSTYVNLKLNKESEFLEMKTKKPWSISMAYAHYTPLSKPTRLADGLGLKEISYPDGIRPKSGSPASYKNSA